MKIIFKSIIITPFIILISFCLLLYSISHARYSGSLEYNRNELLNKTNNIVTQYNVMVKKEMITRVVDKNKLIEWISDRTQLSNLDQNIEFRHVILNLISLNMKIDLSHTRIIGIIKKNVIDGQYDEVYDRDVVIHEINGELYDKIVNFIKNQNNFTNYGIR